jgi:putative ABC transport system permease protein
MLALVSGHYPAGPGQVALTSQVAALYNTHAGGNWRQGSRARRVAGIVENPGNLADEFALITPGQVGAPTEVTVLFDATPASVSAFRFPAGATVQTPPPPGGVSPAFIVLAAATLGLIFVGLVAVASFTVLARRRLRALGMLGSLGAADRNIALVMTANGAIIGTAGAIAGALAGFAAWSGYRPYLETSAGHRIGVLHLPWPVIGTGMVLAVVTSVLASRRPARAAARMPVHAALAGRPEPPKAARRSALPGVILLLAGPALLVLSGGWGHNGGTATLETLGGMTATIVGGLLLAPFCLTVLAALAGRAPVAVRLALRDLSRYPARGPTTTPGRCMWRPPRCCAPSGSGPTRSAPAPTCSPCGPAWPPSSGCSSPSRPGLPAQASCHPRTPARPAGASPIRTSRPSPGCQQAPRHRTR